MLIRKDDATGGARETYMPPFREGKVKKQEIIIFHFLHIKLFFLQNFAQFSDPCCGAWIPREVKPSVP